MGPTRYLPAYCCARKGCGVYRYAHTAAANAEDLVCSLCGDAFPTETWMVPEPRRPPRDAAARKGSAFAQAAPGRSSQGNAKGKGKGKDKKGYGEVVQKGRGKGGKGGSDEYEDVFPALQRPAAQAKAKAKASASTAPWARTAPSTSTQIHVDPRRKATDPTYPAVIQVLVAKQFGNGADIERAKEELERQRALQESALPPESVLQSSARS
jgi:hypothetical protein